MVIIMAKLRMAHAITHGARKPPGPTCSPKVMHVLFGFKAAKSIGRNVFKDLTIYIANGAQIEKAAMPTNCGRQ